MKNIWFLFIVIFIVFAFCTCTIRNGDSSQDIVNSSTSFNTLVCSTVETSITDNSKDTVISDIYNSPNNEIIAYINNESITKFDLELKKLQNKYASIENSVDSELINDLAKNILEVQLAKKSGVVLSDIEEKEIINTMTASFIKNKEENLRLFSALGLSEEDCLNKTIEKAKNREIVLKWKSNIANQIYDGTFCTDNEKLKTEINELVKYKNSLVELTDDSALKIKTMTEKIYNEYINISFANADFIILYM